MLSEFLKSVADEYMIEFRNDGIQRTLELRVSRDGMTKSTSLPYEYLTNELSIVRVIREAIDEIDEGLLGQ